MKTLYTKNMKKLLFFLLAFLSVPAFAVVGDYTTFDFTNPKELNISPAIQSWDGSFDGQGVQVTSKVITSKDIQISFTLGIGQGGVYIPRRSITIDGKTSYYYDLEMRSGSTIKIRTTNGCELDSVKFTGSTGTLTSSTPKLYDAKTKTWKATTSTDTVVIENGARDTGIQTIEVYYKKPSKPLNFVSSTPSAGGEVTTFNSMTLNFNLAIASSNANGITLSGPGIQSPVAMSASVRGTLVTLSTAKTYTAYGNYTVNVPAGAFKNSEGGTHDALSIPFKVNPKRDILTWQSVNPAEGTVEQLPETIEVIYNEYVSVPANAFVNVYKDGAKQFTAPVKLTEGNTKSVTVAHSRGEITDKGVWSFEFPAKTVYNGMMGDEAEERWNPAFTLTYTVKAPEPIDPPTPPLPPGLEVAKQLKDKTDNGAYGYPIASSEGYTAIAAVVNKGEAATSDEINEAIGKYFKETNVKMPEAGKWYRIAGVNDDDSKAYLTYADQKVTLKSSYTSADAFLAVAGNGGMEFKTKDDRFLTVLGNPSGIEGFTTPQSGKATQLSIAKLALENYADSTKIIGKFTISGWLGRNANDEDLGNSTAAISYPSLAIVTSPTSEIYFSSNTSSAFIFEETNEPSPTPCAQADVTFDNNSKGIEIDKAGDPIIIVVNNVQNAEICGGSLPYFAKQNQIGEEEKITTTTQILTPISDSFYRFNVNTTGLAAGEYLLYIPAETFCYTPTSEYSCVDGTDAVLSITIKGSDPTPTLPDITFDDNTKSKVIDETVKSVTLVVQNVQSAVIANASLPYFKKSGTSESIPAPPTMIGSCEFTISTSNLAAGEYSLHVPAATFSYTPTIVGTDAVLSLTISADPTPTLPELTFDDNTKRKEIEAGTPITLVVHNVQSANIANSSLPYFKKSGSSETKSATPTQTGSCEFTVSTTGLEAGDYSLNVPAETFSYTPPVDGTDAVLSLTIKSSAPNPDPFIYTYPFNAEVKMLMDPDVHYNVAGDIWLNEIIFYTFDRSTIVPDTTVTITLTNINGATVRTGHLKTYPNYKKEMPYPWLNGSIALKLVFDQPFEKWELKYRSGTYFLLIPSKALGDANFGKYLKNNKFTGKCEVNKETSIAFIVNDGVLPPDTLTPSASLSTSSVEPYSSLTLTIKDGGTVTLKDASKVKYQKGNKDVDFTGTILTEASNNSFAVNIAGLDEGDYTLVLPAGTFEYNSPGNSVEDKEMKVSFTIIPTSIIGIRSTEDDGIYYDLSGRKVTAPTEKGIYIKNGRKVVVK